MRSRRIIPLTQGIRQDTALVLGGGITGLSAAIWLARAGIRVTLVDRYRPGDPGATSFGNAGIVAGAGIVPVPTPALLRRSLSLLFSSDSPLFLRWSYLPRLLPWLIPYLRSGLSWDKVRQTALELAPLVDDAIEQHSALTEDSPAQNRIQFGEYGYLYRSAGALSADKMSWDIRYEAGFRWEEREGPALAAHDPQLNPEYGVARFLSGHGWVNNPGAYMADLGELFVSLGGEWVTAEVEDIQPRDDGAEFILQDGRRLSAGWAVLAGGAWSGKLASRLGHNVGLESERGYHLFLEGCNLTPPAPYMIADRRCVITPMEKGVRCAGLVELAGLDAPEREAPVEYLRRSVRHVFPNISWQKESSWIGRRPSTRDSLANVRPVPALPAYLFRVWLAPYRDDRRTEAGTGGC